jgi:hypothetical protein
MKSIVFWAFIAGFFNGVLLRLRDLLIEQEYARDS